MKRFHNHCNATCIPRPDHPTSARWNLVSNICTKSVVALIQRASTRKRSQTLRQSWGVGEGTAVLMCVSRVSPEKVWIPSLKASKRQQLQQLHRHVKLVIVGDGPCKALVKRHANYPPRAGFQDRRGAGSYYASADALYSLVK